MKLGRNDPCPCGSGKKYKRCCYGKDTAAARAKNASELEENRFKPSSATELFNDVDGDVMSTEFWDDLEKKMPADMRKEHADIFSEIKSMTAFDENRTEIEQASNKLEKYKKKFDRLCRNPGKLLKMAEKLFSEECFEPMRFTTSDLQRAFDKLGYMPSGEVDESFFEKMRNVIYFMADKQYLDALSLRLMHFLPAYVAKKRYMDAWVIQHSAVLMRESDGDVIPPFLMSVFMRVLDEWEDDRDSEQAEMFSKFGVNNDDIQRGGFDGVDSLVREIMSKEGADEEVHEFLDKHPELKALTEAQCNKYENDALDFLDREDARSFLLSYDDIEEWIPVFEKRLSEDSNYLERTAHNKPASEEDQHHVFDIVYSVSRDMADALLTKERLNQLKSEIHAYRKKLRHRDKKLKMTASALIMAIQSESAPSENHVLTMFCLYSFRAVVNDMQTQSD